MKKNLIAMVIVFCLLASNAFAIYQPQGDEDLNRTASTLAVFTDVKETDWFYPAVEYMVLYKVMNGKSASQFDPEANITRAELVQILYTMGARNESNQMIEWTDIFSNQWYEEAATYSGGLLIQDNTDKNVFNGDRLATRGDVAYALYRSLGGTDFDLYFDSTNAFINRTFKDIKQTAGISRQDKESQAVAVCVWQGFMSGYPDGTVRPSNHITRAETATIFMNLIKKSKA